MQTRKLTLKTERLAELTADQLVAVAGGARTIDLNCVNNRVSDLFVVTGCPGCWSAGYCTGAC